jgi:hypothetical protein
MGVPAEQVLDSQISGRSAHTSPNGAAKSPTPPKRNRSKTPLQPTQRSTRRRPQSQPESHVPLHRQVRVENIVLEHHGDVPISGRDPGNVSLSQADRSARRQLQPGNQPQGGRLATPARTDQHQQLAFAHTQAQVVHCHDPAWIDLRHIVNGNARHIRLSTPGPAMDAPYPLARRPNWPIVRKSSNLWTYCQLQTG